MNENHLRLKWVHASCRNPPCYLSSSKICFSCENVIQIRDVGDDCYESTATPGKDISCMATIPFLGTIAVSDTERRPTIRVFRYPAFELISQMCRGFDVVYLAMCFTGMDYLVTFTTRSGDEIVLWNWKKGETMFVTSPSCCYIHNCISRLSLNPSSWFQMCLEQGMSLTFLEIKGYGTDVSISQRCVILPEDRRQNVSPIAVERNHAKRVSVTSHCWISNDKIVVSCEDGTVMSVDILNLNINVLYCFDDNVVTCLAYNNDGLFLGKNDGCVLCVDIRQHKFKLLETLNIGPPVMYMTFSPNFENLTIVTARGAVFSYESGSNNIHHVVPGDESPIIGICMLYPESYYCVTAHGSGLLQVWCMRTGKLVSWFQVDESIQSITSSPLSATVLVSTIDGYLYFLSFADVCRIRTVNVSKPYASPVEHVVFDNYGRYIAVASCKEIIHIFGGQPFSGFLELGNRESFGSVIDMSLCTTSEFESTALVILIRSDLCHRQDLGDTLVKMDLPRDLSEDPLKYHFDVLGSLSEEALNIQTWRLQNAASKLVVHSILGALIYSPVSFEIQTFQIWLDETENIMTEAWIIDASSSLKICDLKISPDHNWLVSIDINRRLCLYGLWGTHSVQYQTEILRGQEVISTMSVSEIGNNVVVGSENGLISCFNWDNPQYSVPSPWILKCREMEKCENLALGEMEREEPQCEECIQNKLVIKKDVSMIIKEIEGNLRTLCLMLDLIVEQSLNERVQKRGDVELSHDHEFYDAYSSKLSLDNYRRFRKQSDSLLGEEQAESNKNEECQQVIVKALRSSLEVSSYVLCPNIIANEIHGDAVVETLYNSDNVAEDLERNLKLLYITAPGLPFDATELRSKDQKFELIHFMNGLVNSLKFEFNNRLATFSKLKIDVFHRICEKVRRMVDISSLTEIKEPFWESLTSCSESGLLDSFGIFEDTEDGETNQMVIKKFDHEIELKKLPPKPDFMVEKPQTEWTENENVIALEYSTEIEKIDCENLRLEFKYLKQSVIDNIAEFDQSCGKMQELKTLCNFMTYEIEIQIFILLLWNMSDAALQAWDVHFKDVLLTLQSIEKPAKTVTQTMEELSSGMIESYKFLQYLERKMEANILHGCAAFGATMDAKLYEYNLRRPQRENALSKNPFLPRSPQYLSTDLLSKELESLKVERTRPKRVNKVTWKRMCESRVWKFTAEQLLQGFAVHIDNIGNVVLKWKDFEHGTEDMIKTLTDLITQLSVAHQTFDEAAETLLQPNYEMEVMLSTDLSSTSESSKSSQMFTAIRQGNFRNEKLQDKLQKLEEIISALGGNPKISESQELTSAREFELKMKTLHNEVKRAKEELSTAFTFIKPVYAALTDHTVDSFEGLFSI